MDIFEIAQQGMKLQEEEKQREAEEAQAQETEKKFKLDIQEALQACAKKDYDWYNRLGDHQKHFQPFILNMWLAQVNSPNTSRAIDTTDQVYADIVRNINDKVNAHLFSVPKEMLWLLACTVNDYNIDSFNMDWVRGGKKGSSSKVDTKIMDYMAQELWTSKDKISDMIDNGLISPEDIKAISKDLETLEDPKKKKK
jgi:hypothetical protein